MPHTLGSAYPQPLATSNGWDTPEKKCYGYGERDEEQRRAFWLSLVKYSPITVVYLDETGLDERNR